MAAKSSINGSGRAPDMPPNLGPSGRSLWADIHASYQIGDPPAIELLKQACCAADRVARVAAQIDREGETFTTNAGIVRPHPLLAVELANRQFIAASLKKLGLLEQPVRAGPGRPSEAFGWRPGAEEH